MRIAERIATDDVTERLHPVERPTATSVAVPMQAERFSPPGNPAPTRGLPPSEYMYEADIHRNSPYSPYFTRGLVDVNGQIRNLALQAYVKAGGKVV